MSFNGARIGGRLNLEGATVRGDLFCGPESGQRCEIEGEASLAGATVEGAAVFNGARIGGKLKLHSATVRYGLFCRPIGKKRCEIGGQASLAGATVEGHADFIGVCVSADLVLSGATIEGDVLMWYRNWRKVHKPNDPQGAELPLRAVIRGDLHAKNATITGDVDLRRVDVEGSIGLPNATLGELRLGRPEGHGAVIQELKDTRTTCRELRLDGLQARGDVDLSWVKVLPEGEDKEQKVCLNATGARLGGELLLWKDPAADGGDGHPNRKTDLAILRHGKVELADVQASGLRITGDCFKQTVDAEHGRVPGEDDPESEHPIIDPLTGLVRLASHRLQKAGQRLKHAAFSSVRWLLKLDREAFVEQMQRPAHTQHPLMWLLFDGFSADRYWPNENRRISLERSVFRRVRVREPLPRGIDLANLKVDRWDPPARDHTGRGANKDRPRFFVELLRSSEPFSVASYAGIERTLRDRGERETANRIHAYGERRNRRTDSGWLRVLGSFLLDVTTAYGTRSWRLLAVVGATFVFSTACVFGSRENFVPTADLRGVSDAIIAPDAHPDEEDWGWGSAAWVSLQHQIPIVQLTAKSDWKPADQGFVLDFYVIEPLVYERARFSVEDYANLVLLTHWVIVPLLVLNLSGYFRRRN